MRFTALSLVLLLQLFPALALAQSTGGSFGGGSFGRRSGSSSRSSTPSSSRSGSSGFGSSSPASSSHDPFPHDPFPHDPFPPSSSQSDPYDDSDYGSSGSTAFERTVTAVLVIGAVVLLLLAVVGFWFRDIFRSLVVGIARRKESCLQCGNIDHPKRGRCPKCGGEMESIL